ncbi:metal-dependent hydrolase [Nibribacter ruber]|uniref:Metal-dependent hydrolase n=1 Tax=Nibribacter ruber TaxID=2698458 RepID=A0A6P1P3K1_9BACT|nr:metal-dependent hydrolase [Nibribacter ruber]QHL89024.1 metal-dependent hydrolase [Nibribacter ruber]
MASAFAHALLAVAISKTSTSKKQLFKFSALAAFCAVIPDADVVMFKFGVPYEHFLGHRGFSHSLAFALLLGVLVTKVFYRGVPLQSRQGLFLIFIFFLCTASHSLLDAMTTGGLGVAVFSPFDNNRYFLPWRPIQVSPIGIKQFLGPKGLAVIQSELIWVGIPSVLYLALVGLVKRLLRK